ncbi:MAG: TspO/MBR family protein [Acidithiobacillus sp.]
MIVSQFAIVTLISLAITLGVATTGSFFRPDAWYERLRKPRGTPPPWVFPLVWTLLYILMAFSAALVYLSPESSWRVAGLIFYALQLLANAAWSWIFFRKHQILWALGDLILLLLLVLVCLGIFATISATAAWLLLPYVIWLLVALYLNAASWWLNRKNITF